MPPSSMKGKRESNENASNMSDLGTSSEEEEAPVAAAAAVIMSTVKQEPGTTKHEEPGETMTHLIEVALKEARVIHQATLEAVEAELDTQNIKMF